MLEEKDSDKSAIRFLTPFEEAIQAAQAIEPGKGAFDLPPLAAVPFVLPFLCRAVLRFEYPILSIGRKGNEPALPEGCPHWVTLVAFIEAHAFGATTTFANFDAIESCEDFPLVRAIRFAQSTMQRIPVGVHDQMAFEAANPGFSRVAYLVFSPLFDLITLASW